MVLTVGWGLIGADGLRREMRRGGDRPYHYRIRLSDGNCHEAHRVTPLDPYEDSEFRMRAGFIHHLADIGRRVHFSTVNTKNDISGLKAAIGGGAVETDIG